MKENEHILRAVKDGENGQFIQWRDGGVDMKVDGIWWVKWSDGEWIRVDESRSRWLDRIRKKDISLRTRC